MLACLPAYGCYGLSGIHPWGNQLPELEVRHSLSAAIESSSWLGPVTCKWLRSCSWPSRPRLSFGFQLAGSRYFLITVRRAAASARSKRLLGSGTLSGSSMRSLESSSNSTSAGEAACCAPISVHFPLQGEREGMGAQYAFASSLTL